jgi:hypothetical protein
MCDSIKEIREKTAPNLTNENPSKKAPKIPLKKKNTGNKRYGTRLREIFH